MRRKFELNTSPAQRREAPRSSGGVAGELTTRSWSPCQRTPLGFPPRMAGRGSGLGVRRQLLSEAVADLGQGRVAEALVELPPAPVAVDVDRALHVAVAAAHGVHGHVVALRGADAVVGLDGLRDLDRHDRAVEGHGGLRLVDDLAVEAGGHRQVHAHVGAEEEAQARGERDEGVLLDRVGLDSLAQHGVGAVGVQGAAEGVDLEVGHLRRAQVSAGLVDLLGRPALGGAHQVLAVLGDAEVLRVLDEGEDRVVVELVEDVLRELDGAGVGVAEHEADSLGVVEVPDDQVRRVHRSSVLS